MRYSFRTTSFLGAVLFSLLIQPPAWAEFKEGYDDVKPILESYCSDCHSGKKQKGGLNFDEFKSEKDVMVHLKKWFSVIEQVETGVMPPEDRDRRPSREEVDMLIAWVRKTIDEFDYDSVKDPGPASLRRLTKAEYDNTIRDLTGVDLQPARYFSGDGAGGEGFDNNAEGMSMPPMLVEKYFEAAREISQHADVSYMDGITFGVDPVPTHSPRAYQVLVDRRLTDFYNDFFDKLPKYNPRTEFQPYLMPAMKLALEKPEVSNKEIYDLAIEKKLMPGVFYRWVIAFTGAEEDIKTSRWDSHYGHWVLDPWLELQSRRESVTDEELKAFHDDFAAKVQLAVPATAHMNKPGLEVKTDIEDGAETLYLSVGDMDDGNEFDHVVLHDPKVTLKDGSVVSLGDLEMIEKQGEGAIHRDQFPDGTAFVSTASGKDPVKRGFYVDAPALLTFKLPANAKSFTAMMGLEKSAEDKGSVQVYASTDKIPFPEGKHTHSWFYRGTGNFAVEEGKKWWVVYSALVGYGKSAGAKEMVDVSLNHENRARLESIQHEVEFSKRQPIEDFFQFIEKKKFGRLLKTREGELPALADLPAENREAPAELSEQDRKQWNDLRKSAEEFQAEMDGRVKDTLLAFAERTFRRPLEKGDAQAIVDTYDQSMAATDDFQRAAQLAIQGMLTHPRFLFRKDEEAPDTSTGEGVSRVDDYSLASRLSYFLWSSMPDETLLGLAKEGRLHDEKVLVEQVRRMLKDPKSISLSEQFAAQWLGFRKILDEKQPDAKLFPTYTKELKDAMFQEAVMTFDDIVKRDLSVLEILDSKTAFLNETLAKHYGISGVEGEVMRRVDLATNQRGGFPTMGSVLVATSWPERTSPVVRGKWVLDVLMGGVVPPPPEGVKIDQKQLNDKTLTKKQRLAAHSTDSQCAVCHDRIDPLGFTLENFDAIGRFRTRDGDFPVESVGELKGGPKVAGFAELKNYLKTEKRDAFLHQISQKLLGFALGRSLEYYDESIIRQGVADLKAEDDRFSALVVAIARSYPFQYQREKGHLTDAE